MKKLVALTVVFLFLGAVFAAAQEANQTQVQEKARVETQLKGRDQAGAKSRNRAQVKSEFRQRNRVAFVDENGDGINDLARDADGDGVPNCQDPDWTRPLDGSGYRAQAGKGGTGTATGSGYAHRLTRDDDGDGVPNGQDPDWVRPADGTGYQAQHRLGQAGRPDKAGFGKGAFRSGASSAARASGTGVCDGAGPKGTAQRKGRR